MPDRLPGRHPAPAWLRPFTQRLSPTIRNIVIAESVLFGLFIMAAPLRVPIVSHLGLGPGLMAGEVWQPLTSLFVHTDFVFFFFNMLGLWFVGASIEQTYGRWRFLLIFLGTGLAANLVIAAFIALGIPMGNQGCGDSVLALFVALGVAYGRTQIRVWGQLVLQARVLAWIFVGLAVVSMMLQRAWFHLLATLVAIALAYVLAGGKVGPILAILVRPSGKRRSSLGVMEGGRAKGGRKYVN